MTSDKPHRMLVIHNDAGSGGQLRTIGTKPFRRFAFGSLLAYAEETYDRLYQRKMLVCHSLPLPGGIAAYGAEHLRDVVVEQKYDSVMCHLILDHGGVLTDGFFDGVRSQLLTETGLLLNPVKSISKTEVARASQYALETQSAPCVIKKDDNYNEPATVLRFERQAELDAWRQSCPAEEQRGMVVHKLLDYVGRAQSKMYQLERWIVLFGDLTVNHRCSDEFYIKSGTSLSFYVRDERRMAADLSRLAQSGFNWKGRSIDCSYQSDAEGWDARYAVLAQCRDAFHFDYAELDVMQPSKNEFVVIDVNQTPGPFYKNLYFRELAVRLLSEGLGIQVPGARFADAARQTPRPAPKAQEVVLDANGIQEEMAKNSDDAHSKMRLAQSYLASGQLEQALGMYRERANMEQGSDEERFIAQLEVGRISVRLQASEPVVLSEFLAAYMLRPSRAEPLYELARFFRQRNNGAMAMLFAKAGVQTPRPLDGLGVEEAIYEWRLLDELGLAAQSCGDQVCAKQSFGSVLERVQAGIQVPEPDRRRIQSAHAQITQNLATPTSD